VPFFFSFPFPFFFFSMRKGGETTQGRFTLYFLFPLSPPPPSSFNNNQVLLLKTPRDRHHFKLLPFFLPLPFSLYSSLGESTRVFLSSSFFSSRQLSHFCPSAPPPFSSDSIVSPGTHPRFLSFLFSPARFNPYRCHRCLFLSLRAIKLSLGV